MGHACISALKSWLASSREQFKEARQVHSRLEGFLCLRSPGLFQAWQWKGSKNTRWSKFPEPSAAVCIIQYVKPQQLLHLCDAPWIRSLCQREHQIQFVCRDIHMWWPSLLLRQCWFPRMFLGYIWWARIGKYNLPLSRAQLQVISFRPSCRYGCGNDHCRAKVCVAAVRLCHFVTK